MNIVIFEKIVVYAHKVKLGEYAVHLKIVVGGGYIPRVIEFLDKRFKVFKCSAPALGFKNRLLVRKRPEED